MGTICGGSDGGGREKLVGGVIVVVTVDNIGSLVVKYEASLTVTFG